MLKSKIISMLLALILGALMPLSFAPFGLAMVAPLALVGLLFLIRSSPPKFSAFLGVLFGFGMFAWGIWWIRISLIEFGGAPVIMGVLLTFLLALYLALYYGVLCYTLAKVRWPFSWKFGVLFPLLAVLLEWIRAELFSGFPWLALGYTLTDLSISAFLFPTMGALMASFWVYWLGGILFLMMNNLYRKREEGGYHLIKQLIPTSVTAIVMGGGVLISSTAISQKIERVDEPLNIALLQGNIAQELKFNEAQYYEILATYLRLTEDVSKSADLIIWPETAIPSLYELEVNLGEQLRKLSRDQKTKIMTGIFTGSGQTVRNSIVTYSDEMRMYDQRYDKTHLVPFGEYIPFRAFLSLFSGVIEIPYSDLTKGKSEQAPFKIQKPEGAALFAAASICYEAVFGDELRYQALTSNFLVNVSNDAWFGDSIGPWQHFQIARARSIELQREMVRATNNGITALIGKDGAVKVMLPQFEEGTLSVDVTSYEGMTAYAKLGDLFWVVISLLGLIFSSICYYRLQPKFQ